MAKFNYKVVDKNGKQKSGAMEGQNEDAVKSKLKQEGYSILEVSESKDVDIKLGGGGKPKNRDLSVFCKQFGAILRAGVPIIQALEMLSETVDNQNLAQALRDAQVYVQKGGTLSDAFKQNPKVFPARLFFMVNAG